MDNALIIAGLAGNLLISSGVLWKLIDFARGYGKLEKTVEVHDRDIEDLKTDVQSLRR